METPESIILKKVNVAPLYSSKSDFQKELMSKILGNKDKLISTYFYSLPKDAMYTLNDTLNDTTNDSVNVSLQFDKDGSNDNLNVDKCQNEKKKINYGNKNQNNNEISRNENQNKGNGHTNNHVLYDNQNNPYNHNDGGHHQLDDNLTSDQDSNRSRRLNKFNTSSSLHPPSDYEYRYFKYWNLGSSDEFVSIGNWKIKFLLSTTVPDPGLFTKLSFKMLSYTGSWLDVLPKFGLFHTALIIGPHKIEWLDTSLCVPRQAQSTNSVLLLDIGVVKDANHYKWIRERLGERIAWWNLNMNYQFRASDNWEQTKLAHCQHFVNDIVKHLDLEEKLKKTIQDVQPVLDRIIQQGDNSMELKVSRPFFELFPISQSDIKKMHKLRNIYVSQKKEPYPKDMMLHFVSHRQLDLYVSALQNIDPDVLSKDFSEVQVLKAFDRSFWLQKNKHTYIQASNPHHEIPEDCIESEDSCPFLPPDLTSSILSMPSASFKEVLEEYNREMNTNIPV